MTGPLIVELNVVEKDNQSPEGAISVLPPASFKNLSANS